MSKFIDISILSTDSDFKINAPINRESNNIPAFKVSRKTDSHFVIWLYTHNVYAPTTEKTME